MPAKPLKILRLGEDGGEGLRNYLRAGNKRCPECSREVPEDAKVCPYCGVDLEVPRLKVPGL